MIVKLVRPKADHIHWQIVGKEGFERYVPRADLPARIAAQAEQAEATYWFASMAAGKMVIHDTVPPQEW